MKARLTLIAVVCLTASSAQAQVAPKPLLLTGAKVLDATGETFLENQDVLVVNGRIAQVSRSSEMTVPPEALRLDLRGLSLLPGLIDLHSHLLLRPYSDATWEDQVLRESLEFRTIRAVAAGQATLEAGFTTLRDMGTEGAGFADVALRDAFALGIARGPRIFASTRAIVATGCYGPMGFDPRWDIPKGAQVADGIDGVRRAVREQIAAGADWVKVYADYRRRPNDLPTPTFSQEELDTIVVEARSAGRPVAAHASTSEGIRRAVLAGVKSIEHGSDASEEALKLMREQSVTLCPTLAASEAMARYEGWKDGEPDPPRIQGVKATFGRALRSGVTIACGSDVGVFAHGDNAREIELMAAYGMSPTEALRAATITAARTLGREKDLGRIAPGYIGDLVAVQGDPLKDPKALRKPVVVIKEGQVVLDRR
jgi:imidazolonepropionase-like amidohydrolase